MQEGSPTDGPRKYGKWLDWGIFREAVVQSESSVLAPSQITIAFGAHAVHTHIGSEVSVCCDIQVSKDESRDG